MKKSWVRHEKLCAQLEACSLDLKQNEAQMDILTATGGELKEKHKKIRGLLDEAKANGEKKLREAIMSRNMFRSAKRIGRAVKGDRKRGETDQNLAERIAWCARQKSRHWRENFEYLSVQTSYFQCQMIRLGAEVKKNETYVQLACIDIERMELRHEIRWVRRLALTVSS